MGLSPDRNSGWTRPFPDPRDGPCPAESGEFAPLNSYHQGWLAVSREMPILGEISCWPVAARANFAPW